MSSMLIAFNGTRDNGQFMGDQLCYLKAAQMFVRNCPVDRVLLAMSPANEMHFLWQKFIDDHNVEVVYDTFNPGDNEMRWVHWNKWRSERNIEGRPFDHYRELYLRIHGAQRQVSLCGSERGLGRANIYEYLWYGQENAPETPPVDVSEWDNLGVRTRFSFDSDLIYRPSIQKDRDVYISPHAKTQGNVTFTFEFWAAVLKKLIDAGVSVTVGYNGYFCEELLGHHLYRKHWGDHKQWLDEVCRHKLVACGNTGTGWLAAAAGTPMITMEPPGSVMADHRFRECGLRNLVDVVDTPDADYVAKRIIEEVNRVVVLTTGCYDVLHAGHVKHLERARAIGTKLIVAMNTDASVKILKGETRPINPEDQRRTVLQALRAVDEVRLFDGDNAKLIAEMKPDVLACGFGYTLDTIVGRDAVEAYGGRAIVTCTGDISLEPSTTKVVSRILRARDVVEVCRAAGAYSVNPYEKLKLMADELLKTLNLPGAVADVGAYRGGTSLILRRLAPDKRLYLFDTWSGTPFNDDLCHHKKGEWAVSLVDCKKLVGEAEYREGVFPYTAEALDEQFCFVFVDPDTYQTVRDAITYFWPKLVPGGRIVFDDYGWEPCAGVKKAVDEAFTDKIVFPQLHTCVVVKS